MELLPLAAQEDVMRALGFDPDWTDITALPTTMQVRMGPTLSKVSRRFRKEAQRIFTPGTYTHRLQIHAGSTRLMEAPSEIEDVTIFDRPDLFDLGEPVPGGIIEPVSPGSGPVWTVDGQWMYWADWDYWQLNGLAVGVTYSWTTAVPSDVVAAVADITARNLVVDPMGAVRQSKLLMSRHFRQEVADWVMSGDTGFTKDDIEQAQSYRSLLPPVIIARVGMVDASPSSAFLSDSSW